MSWLRSLFRRVRGLVRSEKIHREIEEEAQFHIDLHAAEKIRHGMSPEEARREAEQRFGNPTRLKEQGYDIRGGRWLEALWQDLRYAVRMFAKKPSFTLIAVLTLALGIGANTAIFSIVKAVLLRPLPFSESDRLIGIRETKVGEGHNNPMAWRSFLEFRDRAQTLDFIAAYTQWNPDIEHEDDMLRLQGTAVSYDYFKALSVRPLLGRDFTPEDGKEGAPRTVMLGYDLWQQLYGGDREIVGRSVRVDGRSLTIIGVMPQVNVGGQIGWRSIWTPLRVDEAFQLTNAGRWVQACARLKPGVTLDQAQAELTTLIEGLRQSSPLTHSREIGVYATGLKDHVIRPNSQKALWVLFGAVICVLLIACANVANLLLARATEREKELALRAALGAGRSRIVRQLLSESVLLAVIGALAGGLLAHWILVVVAKFSPEDVRRMGEIRLDMGVLMFALALGVGTGLLFGLVPALSATKLDLNLMLKEGARAAGESWRQNRLRSSLVVLEIAMALVLLIGSGLLLKSFANLRNVELGFNPDNLLTMSLRLSRNRYPEVPRRVRFFQEMLENVKRLPGVHSAGICFSFPMSGQGATDSVVIEGRPPVRQGEEPVLRGGSVSGDYFKTMGISLQRGRVFTEEEVWEGRDVIIVNEAFARRFFPSEDPIGKRIKVGYHNPPWTTIIGVVADHIQPGLDNRVWEEMFYPYVNAADPPLWGMNLVVKTRSEPAAMANAVVHEMRKGDRLLPVANIKTMHELMENALATDRFNLWLLGSFAFLALLLASVGIYGVISDATVHRTREIGVRIALGAQSGDVLTLVVRQGLMLALLGVALGLTASLVLTRLMKSFLFQVSATDPLTFAAVVLLLVGVALLACWIPAQRAAKVDPMIALRWE